MDLSRLERVHEGVQLARIVVDQPVLQAREETQIAVQDMAHVGADTGSAFREAAIDLLRYHIEQFVTLVHTMFAAMNQLSGRTALRPTLV